MERRRWLRKIEIVFPSILYGAYLFNGTIGLAQASCPAAVVCVRCRRILAFRFLVTETRQFYSSTMRAHPHNTYIHKAHFFRASVHPARSLAPASIPTHLSAALQVFPENLCAPLRPRQARQPR